MNINHLQITDEPYEQPIRAQNESKYHAIFSRLKAGQRIVCATEDVGKLSNALRKWVQLNRDEEAPIIRSIRKCADGKGGVWWLPNTAEPAAATRKAKPVRTKHVNGNNPWTALASKGAST